MSQMGNRGKNMQGPHNQQPGMHPGMGGGTGGGVPQQQQQQPPPTMHMPNQGGPVMPGMNPGHQQMMQGAPPSHGMVGPGGQNPNMGGSGMVGHGQQMSMGMGPGGGMPINNMPSNMPVGQGGMSDNTGGPGLNSNVPPMGGMQPASGGMQPMQGHMQQQQQGPNMGGPTGQMHGMGMPVSMPGGSSSPNLAGPPMAGGTMGPPNQSVDPSTSHSKIFFSFNSDQNEN